MPLTGEALRIALRVAQAGIPGLNTRPSESAPPPSLVNAVRNAVERRGLARPGRDDARAAVRLAIRSSRAAERVEAAPLTPPDPLRIPRDSGLGAGPDGQQYLTRVLLTGTDQNGQTQRIVVPVFSSEPISAREAQLRALGQIPDDERASSERYRADRRLRLEGTDALVIGIFRSA